MQSEELQTMSRVLNKNSLLKLTFISEDVHHKENTLKKPYDLYLQQ